MNRHSCDTTEVQTKFGKMFTHVEHEPDGTITGVSISTKQKSEDTDVDVIIRALAEAIDKSIKHLREE